ncbi:unnamed protein product, partial [Soboliphyme baturini]|uniref:G_PROTEIN_RECEP_F3_4 domain-containing protein n=1 Tax=Soboliphyme baturini TaxID=241478 RepID=A0A183J3I9_9BILA
SSEDLQEQCAKNNIHVVSVQSFYGDPAPARQDVRIIVGLFYEKEARKVFCEVYKEHLYGKHYVWIILGWYGDSWFIPTSEDELNCTAEQMYDATQYHFTTEMLMHSQEETRGISGMNSVQFASRLSARLDKAPNITGGFPEAPLAYDAIWSAVFALNCSMEKWKARNLTLDDFSYEDATMAQEIYNCMRRTKFRGVSGEVMFSEKGERIAWTLIEQLQGQCIVECAFSKTVSQFLDGKYEVMGYYDYRSDNLSWRNKEKFISEAKSKYTDLDDYIPPDEVVIQEKWIAVGHIQFMIFGAAGALGIIWAIINGSFNVVFRYRRIVAESCAEVNDIMLVGCIVCIVGIVLIGLPTERALVAVEKYFCHARALMLMYGFSLLFGSLFSKALMAHRLKFMATKHMVGEKAILAFSLHEIFIIILEEIKSWMFYTIIGLFLCMDTFIIAAWITVDPMHRSVQYFDIVDSHEENIKFRPAVEHCTSQNQKIWIGLIYSYKGFLLLFGLFLAYEARNMKTKQMNDSRFVSMAIYNVAILCCITGPVALIITSQPDANFAFCAVTIILCTFTSMGLLFVPKMKHVFFEPNFTEENYFGDGNLSFNQEKLNALLVKNNELKAQIAEVKEVTFYFS